MDHCYYCGKMSHLECDHMGSTCVMGCGRSVCDDHSFPEFEDGDKTAFTLCKDHLWAQCKKTEGTKEWISRLYPDLEEAKRAMGFVKS